MHQPTTLAEQQKKNVGLSEGGLDTKNGHFTPEERLNNQLHYVYSVECECLKCTIISCLATNSIASCGDLLMAFEHFADFQLNNTSNDLISVRKSEPLNKTRIENFPQIGVKNPPPKWKRQTKPPRKNKHKSFLLKITTTEQKKKLPKRKSQPKQ